MRKALEHAVRDASVLAVAAAVALVWTFLDLARACGILVISVFSDRPEADITSGLDIFGGPLRWGIGDRLINFAPLVESGTAFAVAILAAAIVLGRRRPL